MSPPGSEGTACIGALSPTSFSALDTSSIGALTTTQLRGLTTKYILRRAMAGLLPERILSRPKMGFPVPFGAWVAGSHGAVLDEFVLGGRARERGLFDPGAVARLVAEHRGGANHGERMWSLVNLEIWHRIFIDGEDPSSMRLA
jgi:asparagine synthase (glutamine-hydrolysing)